MGPFIAKCAEHFDGKELLEIGTGTGVLAVYFSQLGYCVTGLDSDCGIIAANQRLNAMMRGEARFVVGDMFHLPFPNGRFDVCHHQGLMEHFDAPDIVAALMAQTEVCRKVIFAVPTKPWTGGVRGDERMWPGRQWLDLLQPFRVLDVFGMAYGGLAARVADQVGRRLTRYKPAWLYWELALRCAGQIGFVITKR